MNFLQELNPAQQEAATYLEGPLLIFAGAGSGKTRVLTYRIARLIDEGVDPYHIIAITFTNKAAREMRERVSNITPLGEQVWVSTFHAACTRILRREADATGYTSGFSIYDTADTKRLIKDCIKEANLSETHYPPPYIMNIISTQKNELIPPEQYEKLVAGDFRKSNIAEVYAIYQRRLKESNAMDFDDIIFKTVELLRDNDDIRSKYQNRFRYVMVDEYQDTNHAQYELVRLLSGYAQNLCVVGDDDQSIYGWRGANIKNILRFENDFPGAKVVKLEQNYRSTACILDAANAVIALNEERAEKLLWTSNARGNPCREYSARDDREEGAFIARTIQDGVKAGAKYGDFAILYRANSQSRSVEDQFVMAGIPYRIFSGVRFYEHMEIKDLLAYLKAINNPADEIAHLRIINVPRRGIGTTSVNKIQAFAYEQNITFSTAMSRAAEIPTLGKKSPDIIKFHNYLNTCAEFAAQNPVYMLLQKIIDDTGYMESIMDGTPEAEDRQSNIKELLAKARAFENENEDSSLAAFLEDVALVADIDNYNEAADAVALMTLHSAKGLEFNAVFIIGLEENIFPSYRSIETGDPAQLEEERRLCYVGFTRARQTLYLTHCYGRMNYGGFVRNKVSSFLKNIPPDCIEYVTMYGKPSTAPRPAALPPALAAIAKPATKPAAPAAADPLKKLAQIKSALTTKAAPPPYETGDNVRHKKYGIGKVIQISPAGADYEVTVQFPTTAGNKKFMAGFAGLIKVDTQNQ